LIQQWRAIALHALSSRVPPLEDRIIYDAFWRTLIADLDIEGVRASEQTAEAFRQHIVSNEGVVPIVDLEQKQSPFRESFLEIASHRSLFATQDGTVGLCPADSISGDIVAVLRGAE